MSILLSPHNHGAEWAEALTEALAIAAPDHQLEVFPEVADDAEVEFLIAWKHPAEDLARYPNLKAILALGAGIDQFLSADYPPVPIVRLADPAMADEMAQFALHWVLHFQRRFDAYAAQQPDRSWQELDYEQAQTHHVGILGFGTIGQHIGTAARALGYPINAWSRTGTDDPDVTSYAGTDELDAFLGASHSIINVLPSSESTSRVINAERLAACREGAVFINIGRGATVDESALLDALNSGPLAHAVLDVTTVEPLPDDSPLWTHPNAHITPHIAGNTLKPSASRLMAENIARMLHGEEPFPVLDRSRGY